MLISENENREASSSYVQEASQALRNESTANQIVNYNNESLSQNEIRQIREMLQASSSNILGNRNS